MPCRMRGRNYPLVVNIYGISFLFASSLIGIPKYASHTEPIQRLHACGDGVDFQISNYYSKAVLPLYRNHIGGLAFPPPIELYN